MAHYNRKDHFYQQAKKQGYPSRSAYKLIEMDRQFKILRSGIKLVDLGSAPGGWLKVAEQRCADVEGKNLNTSKHQHISTSARQHVIIAIDLLPLAYQPSPITHFIQGDFLDPINQKAVLKALGDKADWILSDMSPNLSGIKFKDTSASINLCEAALDFATKTLKPGGGLIVKIFPGPELGPFKKKLKACFKTVVTFIPEATRKTSDEIYLVGERFNP